jgi:predicted nucleic acid-binding protein
MNAEAMIDTNVLVYAASVFEGDRVKTRIAQDLLFNHSIGLSSQVLQEFVVVSTKKVRREWKLDDALDWIEALEDFPCLPIDAALVRFGGEMAMRYQLSYWDGAILAAAHRLDASILYTEDLNHGQVYGSVRVENPFRPH